MNIREIHEGDIEAVIELFRKNYGDDYVILNFQDLQWVKRGIYSDHIIWMVIEEQGRSVAWGACIVNFGDYNDQNGETHAPASWAGAGRLVVDPEMAGHGLGQLSDQHPRLAIKLYRNLVAHRDS